MRLYLYGFMKEPGKKIIIKSSEIFWRFNKKVAWV